MALSVEFLEVALLVCCLYQPVYPRLDKKIDVDTLEDLGRNRNPNDLSSGRTSTQDEDLERHHLPPEVLTFRTDLDEIECNHLYLIKEEGYLTFKLQSPRQACQYTFAGSIMDKCTVAIMCKGKLQENGKSSSCSNNDYFKVYDATNGKEKLCGSSSFDNIPKKARNNGTDLFVIYRAQSKSAVCTVFCVEDVKHGNDKIKKLRQLPINNHYKSNVEQECVCGKRNNKGRVVGGENAQKFEFPWIAPIVLNLKPEVARKPFCSASLINDRYALTAAHCFVAGVTAKKIQLVFHAHLMDQKYKKGEDPKAAKFQRIPGWNFKRETDRSEQSVRVDIEKIIVHPDFDLTTYDYDIAILKLKNRINLKMRKVLPICLPDVQDRFIDFTEKILTMAGWGRPNETLSCDVRILQKLDVPFANRKQCASNKPTKRHICAGYLEGGRDACYGDSGGPLITKLDGGDNQYVLAGVVSAGTGCARKAHYGLYTNIQEVVQWVYYNTQDGIFCLKK